MRQIGREKRDEFSTYAVQPTPSEYIQVPCPTPLVPASTPRELTTGLLICSRVVINERSLCAVHRHHKVSGKVSRTGYGCNVCEDIACTPESTMVPPWFIIDTVFIIDFPAFHNSVMWALCRRIYLFSTR